MVKKKLKKELRAKSPAELRREVDSREKKIVELKFKLAQGQFKNVHEMVEIRKEIAVIKTIITEKKENE